MDDEFMMKFASAFTGTRIIGRYLYPTEWKLDIQVFVDEDASEANTNITFTKVNYFIDQILDGSVFYSFENRWAERALRKSHNNKVLVPYEPSDNIIALVLSAKFNALCEEGVEFGAITLESTTANGVSFMFDGHSSIYLPTMEEIVGSRSYFSQPWWNRDDGSTIDIVPKPNDDLTVRPDYAEDLGFIRSNYFGTTKAKVIRPNFRPRVINGTKNDNSPRSSD